MAKFCGHCGFQLDETAKVCGNCGVPVETQKVEPVPKKEVKKIPGIVSERDEEKAKKIKNTIKTVAVAAVALVVVILVFNIGSSFVGYKGAVRKLMNAYEDYDMNTLVSMASSLNYYGMEVEYIEDNFADAVSSRLDYYEDSVGHDVKISYEISDAFELSDRKFDELMEVYESLDLDTSGVKKVMQVELAITVKGSRSSNTYHNDDLLFIKEDGSWKVLYSGYSNLLY